MMEIRFANRIDDLDPSHWNRLAGADYPFTRHEFLSALEQTGCVGAGTGWRPWHLTVHRNGQWVAAMPLYLKDHSRGEYVFDEQWARGYHSLGRAYYPKALAAIPFTPCVGPRLLHDPALPLAELTPILAETIKTALSERELSSWHGLFVRPDQLESLADQGFIIRQGVQFHWYNRNYQDFEHYLSHFRAARRKQIKRERRRVQEQGITLTMLDGVSLTASHWAEFYPLYAGTYWKKGMPPYLNEAFFQQIGRVMADRVLLAMARQHRQVVAGALFFKGRDTLYGRYWGCAQEFSGLHFETCYYQGLAYCIRHGLARFDAGAQGEHKLARGFEPVLTGSAHGFAKADFAQAIARYVGQEARLLAAYMAEADAQRPFKHA